MNEPGIVWDNHAGLSFRDTERWLPEIVRYRRAGADAVTINTGDSHVTLETLARMAATIRDFVPGHPNEHLMGLTTGDIRTARATGRLAVCLDIEGVFAFGEELSLVEHFYGLGVRWMLLVYNLRNLAGGGCHDADDEGLTPYGRAILEEMDRVGMIKCCSHAGYRTVREVLDGSDRPAIFSHSNPRRLHDYPRNIPDELIRACAAGPRPGGPRPVATGTGPRLRCRRGAARGDTGDRRRARPAGLRGGGRARRHGGQPDARGGSRLEIAARPMAVRRLRTIHVAPRPGSPHIGGLGYP